VIRLATKWAKFPFDTAPPGVTTMPLLTAARQRLRLPRKPGPILELLARLMLAAVFLTSGLIKLATPQSFAVIIDAYGLLPTLSVMPAALLLSILEILAGVGLITDRRGSLALMAALMLIFMAVLAYGIHMGLDVDCGCFGPEDPEAKAFHGLRSALYRDMGLMGAIIFLYLRRRSKGNGAGRRNQVDARRKRCVSKVL
jgi:uncharacterized membrane protein YphA (DoxX/SURF4 family)